MSLVNSLLLYSKYSDNSKFFFGILQQNQISPEALGIKFISIDNKIVRERIRNSVIGISTVPCLLNIFSNGTIEKYEGDSLLGWLQEILRNLVPEPPQPMPPRPSPSTKRVKFSEDVTNLENLSEREEENEEVDIKSMRKARYEEENFENYEDDMQNMQKERERNREEYERRKILEAGARDLDEIKSESVAKNPKKKRKKKKVDLTEITEIDEEDDMVARHRKVPQPKRLRQNDSRYIEDDNLFSGEMPENRKEPKNSIRNTAAPQPSPGMRTSEDPHGTMAKAKALAQGREYIEKETASQTNRPINPRRL